MKMEKEREFEMRASENTAMERLKYRLEGKGARCTFCGYVESERECEEEERVVRMRNGDRHGCGY